MVRFDRIGFFLSDFKKHFSFFRQGHNDSDIPLQHRTKSQISWVVLIFCCKMLPFLNSTLNSASFEYQTKLLAPIFTIYMRVKCGWKNRKLMLFRRYMMVAFFVLIIHLNRNKRGVGHLDYFKCFQMVAKLFPQGNWLVQKNVFSMMFLVSPPFKIRHVSATIVEYLCSIP